MKRFAILSRNDLYPLSLADEFWGTGKKDSALVARTLNEMVTRRS